MAKLYIQKEVSEETIDEIVVDVNDTDGVTLTDYGSSEVKLESENHGNIWVSYDNIDLFIEALKKAKELWGMNDYK